jgi:hypothetical protein
MATTFIKGDVIILSVWTDAVYKPVACLTSNSLNQTRNLIESQNKCNGDIPAVLGSELLLNGDFADDSVWIMSGSVPPTISGGELHITANSSTFRQSIVSANLKIQITYTISETNGLGGFDIRDSTGTNPIITLGTELGDHTVVRESSGEGIRFISVDGFNGKISNISIKEIVEDKIGASIEKQGGSQSYDLAFEGLYIDTTSVGSETGKASHDKLKEIFETGDLVDWEMSTGLTDTVSYYGSGVIGDIEMTAPAGDEFTSFSSSISGSGAVTTVNPH